MSDDSEELISFSMLEIVEMENGDVILQRGGGVGEPFLLIHFSAESTEYLGENKMAVARAMFQAAMRETARLDQAVMVAIDEDGEMEIDLEVDTDSNRTLH